MDASDREATKSRKARDQVPNHAKTKKKLEKKNGTDKGARHNQEGESKFAKACDGQGEGKHVVIAYDGEGKGKVHSHEVHRGCECKRRSKARERQGEGKRAEGHERQSKGKSNQFHEGGNLGKEVKVKLAHATGQSNVRRSSSSEEEEEYKEPTSPRTTLLQTLLATNESFAKTYASWQDDENSDKIIDKRYLPTAKKDLRGIVPANVLVNLTEEYCLSHFSLLTRYRHR